MDLSTLNPPKQNAGVNVFAISDKLTVKGKLWIFHEHVVLELESFNQ